jgi:hypothetical protein
MFGSEILEVAIGIIFIFLLASIICSAIREGLEAWLKTRAAYLEHGIRSLLHDAKGEGLAKSFYEHPLICGLYSGNYKPGKNSEQPALFSSGRKLPSYIPARNFAQALMDLAARGPQTDEVSSHPAAPIFSLESTRANILNVDNPVVQRALLAAIDSAEGNLERARMNIESWYNSAMDRVSGWYKRATQWILLFVGLVVAVSLNVNTLTLADYLYKNDATRTALVARAEQAARDTAYVSRTYEKARADLESLNLPIGWSEGWGAFRQGEEPGAEGWWNNLWAPLLGWLLTALAVTMGAPFWFDLLNKVMVIRSTVKPHEKSLEEASEDRQAKAVGPTVTGPPPAATAATRATTAPGVLLPVNGMNVRDKESTLDGCDVEIKDITSDDQLPPAEGGVA